MARPNHLDLKSLERTAWRSYHGEGLFDILLGLILIAIGVGHALDSTLAAVVLELLALVAFIAGKRLITVPRMGLVKFGSERRARRMRTKAVFAVVALLGLAAYLLMARGGSAAQWLADHSTLTGWLFSIVAFGAFGAMAYWLDLPRLFWAATMYALAIALAELTGSPVVFLVTGALVLAPGLVLLARFLRQYPLPTGGEYHGRP
ncbi:MAG: hypothetical protein GTO22_21915 [Gemmatimonadales bacterium]|nr:hypothetical protein [Gemmatimonadales bacterium]